MEYPTGKQETAANKMFASKWL